MNSIFIYIISIIAKLAEKETKKVVSLEDNLIYSIKTNGREGILIKSKGPNDIEWSEAKVITLHENAGNLLEQAQW